MPDRFDFIHAWLGIKASVIVAAFAGSVAAAIVLRVRSPWQIIAMVTIGLMTSVYFGPLIVDWMIRFGFSGVDPARLENAAGFVAGLAGMAIINGVMNAARRLGGGKADD